MRICSHLLNKFSTKKFIFCALICASRQNITVNLKITYFLKNYVASLFTFFEKSIWNLQIFYRQVFRCKVLRSFIFYFFEFQSTVQVSPSSQGENVLIQQLFFKKEENKLLRYFYKIAKVMFVQNIQHWFNHES